MYIVPFNACIQYSVLYVNIVRSVNIKQADKDLKGFILVFDNKKKGLIEIHSKSTPSQCHKKNKI